MKFLWTLVLVAVLAGIVCAEEHKAWHWNGHHTEASGHDHDSNEGHNDQDHKDKDFDHQPHHLKNPWRHQHFGSSPKETCHYRSTDGVDYDLQLIEKRAGLFKVQDIHSPTTFFLSTCGSVPIPGCEPGTAVCAVDKEGKHMTIGLMKYARWADGARGANVEVIYGGGEKTDDGIPRKAVVEYRCSLPDLPKPKLLKNPPAPEPQELSFAEERSFDHPKVTTESASDRVVTVAWDGATLHLVILSPYACSINHYCDMTATKATCEDSEGTCEWTEESGCKAVPKTCFSSTGNAAAAVVMLLLMAIGVMGMIATCLCCGTCYMLTRRRCKRSSSLPVTHKKKKHVKKSSRRPRGVKKTKKPAPTPTARPSAPVYQPQQQLNPLTYVPMHMYPQFNPYTVGQAVPMVPVATPPQEE